jgi:hypothetical protein
MTKQEMLLLAVALYYPDASDPHMGPDSYLSWRNGMTYEKAKALLSEAVGDGLVSCEYKLSYAGRRMLEKKLGTFFKG